MDVREEYLANAVAGASPVQRLVLLLEAAERFIRISQQELDKKNHEGVHKNIEKAQNIYLELFCTLDQDAGDFVSNLQGLYYLIYNNLLSADVEKNPEILANCLKTAQGITGMWKDAIDKFHEDEAALNGKSRKIRSLDIHG
ncbi:MAG: flagellar export chaperone FliS [bacterium]